MQKSIAFTSVVRSTCLGCRLLPVWRGWVSRSKSRKCGAYIIHHPALTANTSCRLSGGRTRDCPCQPPRVPVLVPPSLRQHCPRGPVHLHERSARLSLRSHISTTSVVFPNQATSSPSLTIVCMQWPDCRFCIDQQLATLSFRAEFSRFFLPATIRPAT